MKILTPAAVRTAEEEIIAAGTSAETLMERAGERSARILQREYPGPRPALLFIGKGNNGGDGLVIARHLARAGWPLSLCLLAEPEKLGLLCKQKLDELLREFPALPVAPFGDALSWPGADGLVIDAILGIGAKGTLAFPLDDAVQSINQRRETHFFRTIAVDGPTGLHQFASEASDGPADDLEAVEADLTLSIGFGKDLFFREELADWVGRIETVPIFDPGLDDADDESACPRALEPVALRPLLPRRKARSHKNTYGRVLIVGGSRGTIGAPLLSATGALRTGAGLVNIAVRSEVFAAASGMAPLETMVSAAGDSAEFGKILASAKAIAVGPGLGTDHDAARLLQRIVQETNAPLVIDADALTLLSQDHTLLAACRHRAILTPHPGEMKRLLDRPFTEAERPQVAREFAETHGLVLVLKGTRTLVAAPSLPLYTNTTGNPGLAAGGSGDLLTGIIAALLGRGLMRCEAARLGVWLHGRAADLALRTRGCEEGLGPIEVATHLAAAIVDLRGD